MSNKNNSSNNTLTKKEAHGKYLTENANLNNLNENFIDNFHREYEKLNTMSRNASEIIIF
jgi:hypothetical protein